MKKSLFICAGIIALQLASPAGATLIESATGPVDIAIPDGNPVGVATPLTVADPSGAAIEDVSVTLSISGGYNGDLYGYLVFQPTSGPAKMAVLLNQIGTSPTDAFGSAGSGFSSVTLSDNGTANGDIHNATGTPSGTWLPDQYQTAGGVNSLDSTFGGVSADGTWTLFLADLSAGGGTSELTSFVTDISVVPEPVTWALGIFGVLLLGQGVRRWQQSQS
jgi:subtilisin-like proprotein convertase family protein